MISDGKLFRSFPFPEENNRYSCLWQKEVFLIFQKQFDPFLAFSEWESCPAQPLL